MRKINIDEEEFIAKYNEGLNDCELGKIFNCHSETIRNKRKSLKLDKNFEYAQKVSKEALTDLVNQNLSDYKIGKMLNINHSWIFQLRKRWGLKHENLTMSKPVRISSRQQQILIGHVLGDGYLNNEHENVSGKIEHGYKQKEYAEWKHKELSGLCSELRYRKRKTIDKRTGIFYESYECRINSNKNLNKYYKIFYDKDGVKSISKEVMNLFTPLSLAVMFMDDGSKNPNGYSIATNCYNKDSFIVFKEKLNSFGLKVSRFKSGATYISAESKNLFTSLIISHIVPSMRYKLHL